MSDLSKVTFRFSDPMPDICVACAAKAANATLLRVNLPMHASEKQMGILEAIGLLFGFFVVRTSPGPLTERLVSFPTCPVHTGNSVLANIVVVQAIDHFSANLFYASPEFRIAFEKVNAPPSPEILASLDKGEPVDSSEFLRSLAQRDIPGPSEFLKRLEHDS